MTNSRWTSISLAAGAVLAAAFVALLWAVPATDAGRDWTAPLIPGGWMAWSFPIALFFLIIASLLTVFTILAIRFPETPRIGVLGIETTRGDRLFITLLGSAFINLGWLFAFGAPLTVALILSLVYAAAVFRWV